MPMSDYDIIQGCLREDPQCQRLVFERYAGRLLTVCLRYARHPAEAEDILQEAFIKIFEHIGEFQFKGSFEGWMRRIVVNTALKLYQRKQFTQEQTPLDQAPDPGEDPQVYAQLGEEELLALIARLPDGYRVVFNLYAIEGFSHKEIGEMLGIQESTSRSQLAKARSFLQAQLKAIQRIAV